MGASGSKVRVDDAKLKPDNISTVSMALDGTAQNKSRVANRQQQPANSASATTTNGPAGHVYSIPKNLPSNPSSVRFTGGAANRSIDLNGNHFYPSSLGKASATSSINNTSGDDPNNNGSKSPPPVKVDIDKSHRHSLASIPHEQLPSASTRGHSRLSQYSLNESPEEKEMAKTKAGRKSGSIALVFLLELASIAGLVVLAYFLHCKDVFEVKREYTCGTLQAKDPSHRESIIFNQLKDNDYYLIFSLAPIGMIAVFEFLRLLIIYGLSHGSSGDTMILKKVGISLPICIRRIIRFIAGFLFGLLLTSILVDAIKQQTGQLRPNFETERGCSNVTDYCKQPVRNATIDAGQLSTMCGDLGAYRSFPAVSAALAAYSSLFLMLYLAFAFPYRALRFARIWAMLAICLVLVFTINAGLATNNHVPGDVAVGFLIGLFFCLYTVFIHVNAFANRLSVSNFLGAKRSRDPINTVEGQVASSDPFDEVSHSNLFADNDKDQWFWKMPNFHIPRVHTLRQSARNMWRKSENYFGSRPSMAESRQNSPRTNAKQSNAYINPAFNGRDDNILANHLHQETRFGGSNGTNQRGSTLRTFQANS